METKDEKTSFFQTLFGKRQSNGCGCGCCGNFVIEEMPDNPAEAPETNLNPSEKNDSDENECCHG